MRDEEEIRQGIERARFVQKGILFLSFFVPLPIITKQGWTQDADDHLWLIGWLNLEIEAL